MLRRSCHFSKLTDKKYCLTIRYPFHWLKPSGIATKFIMNTHSPSSARPSTAFVWELFRFYYQQMQSLPRNLKHWNRASEVPLDDANIWRYSPWLIIHHGLFFRELHHCHPVSEPSKEDTKWNLPVHRSEELNKKEVPHVLQSHFRDHCCMWLRDLRSYFTRVYCWDTKGYFLLLAFDRFRKAQSRANQKGAFVCFDCSEKVKRMLLFQTFGSQMSSKCIGSRNSSL